MRTPACRGCETWRVVAPRIPVRFENILERDQFDYPALLYAVEPDLERIDYLRRLAATQSSGLLSFLTGPPGAGKTTAVYSASVFMSRHFAPVFSVPSNVPLRELPNYIDTGLPPADSRALPCLLDGREVVDDKAGVRQLMSYLNQLVRRRPDLLVFWPTSDAEWHGELRDLAERVGADAFSPAEADIGIGGPGRESWIAILDRLLVQADLSIEELNITQGALAEFEAACVTVGAFLTRVARSIAMQVDGARLERDLPNLVFVMTSMSEVVGEANRLRRAGTFLLKANELVAYSNRSKAADYWRARNAEPAHHLAYMISLFDARLTTMTPSAVNYACAEFGTDQFKTQIRAAGINRSPANSDTTFKSTDFYRFLQESTGGELTSSQKGRVAESSQAAYVAVQGLSRTQHKVINQSICSVADRNVPTFSAATAQFEVHRGNQDLVIDVVAPWNDTEISLEFHHISAGQCKASHMAAYIMDKIASYAIAYNLIPI